MADQDKKCLFCNDKLIEEKFCYCTYKAEGKQIYYFFTRDKNGKFRHWRIFEAKKQAEETIKKEDVEILSVRSRKEFLEEESSVKFELAMHDSLLERILDSSTEQATKLGKGLAAIFFAVINIYTIGFMEARRYFFLKEEAKNYSQEKRIVRAGMSLDFIPPTSVNEPSVKLPLTTRNRVLCWLVSIVWIVLVTAAFALVIWFIVSYLTSIGED